MSESYLMRALDPGERFIWLLDRISCANFVVMADLSGSPLSEDGLRRGLDRLQANHPLLRANVAEDPRGTVAFHRLEGVGIPLTVEVRDEDDWHEPIQAEFDAPFTDPALPLARCHLLTLPGRSVLSLTFHHVIGDGRSAVTLIKELLRYCLRGVESDAPRDVPPPMHSLFPPEFQWGDHPAKAEALIQQMREELLRNGTPADLPFLAHREPSRDPRLSVIRLDASRGRNLQARCRAEGASVHGAVCAAHLIATHRLFGQANAETLYLMCPADLRPYLVSDMSERLSYCATFLRSTYRVDSQLPVWPLAREIGADLRRRLQRGDGHMAYASLPLDRIRSSGPGFDAFLAQVERLPAGSNISNIGRVPSLDDCPEVQSISGALCSLPKHVASLNVGSYKDELIINMTYDAAKFDPELADRLARDLHDVLDLCCK